MELLDRVVLKENFQTPGLKKVIPQNTIGTMRQLIGDMAIVQIGFEDGDQKIISIPPNLIRSAAVEDLDRIKTLEDCIKILNPLFHPGNEYITASEVIYKIEGIKLAINELQDLFKIEGSEELITRKYLDTMSHISCAEKDRDHDELIEILTSDITREVASNPRGTNKKKTEKQEFQEQDFQDESDIKIVINGFEFNIRDEKINLGIITKDELQGYMNAISKLNKLLK